MAATRSRELFTLTVLVVALGIAVGSAKLFGVSMALGAFLAGMVVGRSEFSLRAATEALPMRDAFAVLFFVSVGMLFDPRYLLESPGAGRGDAGRRPARQAAGRPRHRPGCSATRSGSPLSVAVALAQIGEFSFILATAGQGLGVLDDAADEHPGRRGHRLDHAQPAPLPAGRSRSSGSSQRFVEDPGAAGRSPARSSGGR